MAAEAEAAREARAKVIAAEGEMKASRALKEASDVMIESPAGMCILSKRTKQQYIFFKIFSRSCTEKKLNWYLFSESNLHY